MAYRLGTRKSDLAQTQSKWVQASLKKQGIECTLVPIVSAGDQDRKTALYEVEAASPGLFTKQLEDALLSDQIDLAVHSLKDLPTMQPKGLEVVSIPQREVASDCLLIHPDADAGKGELRLAQNAKVGTSSLRREAQLTAIRPDLKIEPIRGNVLTRLAKVRERQYDGVVFAEAGLRRLNVDTKDLIKVSLSESVFVPAPGQGALAVEVRTNVERALRTALENIHDPTASLETRIERTILRELEGGCTLPLGVRCVATSEKALQLTAFLGKYTTQEKKRVWNAFERFDISESDEQNLVAKTVARFK